MFQLLFRTGFIYKIHFNVFSFIQIAKYLFQKEILFQIQVSISIEFTL